MSYMFLVWSNLKRKKLRTAFTMLSILMAFLLFGILSAIKLGLSQGVDVAGADRLVARHKVSIIQTLPVSYLRDIQQIDGVDVVAHATWFGGIYQDPKNFFPQIPIELEPTMKIYPEFVISEEAVAEWQRTRTAAIVGTTTAERFGWKVGDRVPIQATIWPKKDGSMTWEFDIVGIYTGAKKGVDTSQLFFRYDYFDEARFEAGEGQVGWYNIRVSDPDQAERVAEAVDVQFANSFAETKTETEGAFVQAFAKQIGDVSAIITFVLSAVFFTILLVAGNTMALGVRERTNELAVLKALGFKDRAVLGLVLSESILISLLGGGLGLTTAYFTTMNLTIPAFPVFYVPNKDMILGAFLIVGLGFVAGIAPAWQAMRLQIAVGLRR